MRPPRMTAIPVLLALCTAPLVSAHEQSPVYNRISFDATATAEVENDTLVAVLFVQKQGRQTAELTNQVNRSIEKAVALAKTAPGTKVQTLNYRTTPVYQNSNITGWRVRQSIRLESRNSEALGSLIGELQQDLSVQSLDYEVSEEQRRTAVRSLTEKALQRFQERARSITRSMGRERYDIVRLSINDSQNGRQPRLRAMAMEGVARAAAPVAIESGTQDLRITVSGEIEISVD